MNALTCSAKKYLYAIYKLGNGGREVKSTDVARAVGVSKASTAAMVAKLCEQGYIRKEHYSRIELTDKGTRAANIIYTNCVIIKNFLEKNVGVPSETADCDAAEIAVNISENTVDMFAEYIMKK